MCFPALLPVVGAEVLSGRRGGKGELKLGLEHDGPLLPGSCC